jgi:predicted oxidoreductase
VSKTNLPDLDQCHATGKPSLGMMGLAGSWEPSAITDVNLEAAVRAMQTALDSGITFFDHADIYAFGHCESIFGHCMDVIKPDRSKLYVASKCSIRFPDNEGPHRYDSSYDHIMRSVEGTLSRLKLDYLDLYQIHRRDPLTHPSEVGRAMNQLQQEGLVRHVGVSNFSGSQMRAHQEYLHEPIVSVQNEFSLLHLDSLTDGVFDHCEQYGTVFLAYSPIKKGAVLGHDVPQHLSDKVASLHMEMQSQSEKHQASFSQLALAWIRHFPFKAIPVYGSNNPDHIRDAADSSNISLSRSDWYRLWRAARNEPLP